MIGFITVRRGERVALWDRRGEVRLLSGPRRALLWRETVQPLPHLIARPDEYLVVRHLDGRVEHIAGPVEMWQDPARHESIRVEKAIVLGPDEAVMITVQRPAIEEAEPEVQATAARRIVTGPARITPAPDETIERLAHFIAQPGQYLAVTRRDGQRYGRPVVLRVQAGAMHREGHAFILSDNGVWLTDEVPPQYLDLAEDYGNDDVSKRSSA